MVLPHGGKGATILWMWTGFFFKSWGYGLKKDSGSSVAF